MDLVGITYLQMCPVIESSLNKGGHHTCQAVARGGGKKKQKNKQTNKLEEKAISEILPANMTRNQLLRLALLKTSLRNNNNKPQLKSNHKLQQVAN